MTDDDGLLKLEDFLPYRLSVLSNTISGAIAETYSQKFELSIPEWRVIAVLGRYPGASANDVARHTAMDKVAVSRAVSRLIDAGHIKRQFSSSDRRRSILRLSARGKRLYRRIAPLAREYENRLLAALSKNERDDLDRILRRLQDRARQL